MYAQDQWIPLPGNEVVWPQDVSGSAGAVEVMLRDGIPLVRLAPGRHKISGRFSWNERPSTLPVPWQNGILALKVDGGQIARPQRNLTTVWLGEPPAAKRVEDAMKVEVYRLVGDDVPTRLETVINIEVAGSVREELIGPALPQDFIPVSLDSDLPARLEPDGNLRIQVRPGVWEINLRARGGSVLGGLTLPNPGRNMPLRLDKTKPPLGPRELSFATFGLVFLTIGWMGFNGGNIQSAAGLVVNSEGDSLVAVYFLATACAATGGLFSVTVIDILRFRRGPGSFLIDPFGSLAGAMGGMVAITAVVDLIPNIYYGFTVGIAGGIATYLASRFVRLFLELDDPVDAIAVHAGGGIAGVLLVAGFPGEHDIVGQLVFLASAGLFTGVVMLFLFLMLDDLHSLRCSKWDEYRGLTFCPKFVTFDPAPEARLRVKIRRRSPLPKPLPPAFNPRSMPRLMRGIITFLVATFMVLSPGLKPIWEFFRNLIGQL